MIWPFKRQSDEAASLLEALLELHKHVDDARVGEDFTEAERILRHANKMLKARAEG